MAPSRGDWKAALACTHAAHHILSPHKYLVNRDKRPVPDNRDTSHSVPRVRQQAEQEAAATGFDVALVAACRDLYAAIDRLDHAAATRVGISRNDLRALNLLEHGPSTPGTIARELSLTSGSVTSLIDRLEEKGLVRRARDPDDRRGVRVEPTTRMFAELAPLYRGVAERLSALATSYGPKEADDAARHLRHAAQAYVDATKAD